MLLSLNLLKKYLDLPSTVTPAEIKFKLTSTTVEVERVYPVKGKVQGVPGLADFVFEIDNKSLTNRPDLWSHYGIARELAAIFGLKLKPLKFKPQTLKLTPRPQLKVKISDPKACPRYLAARIENLQVAPSPVWLKKALAAVGIRPINNLVDITNYVLIELGQPLHAFDATTLEGGIEVRLAQSGETITTLDGRLRKLTPANLVIADKTKPIAVAGIMGGELTGVTEKTHSLILESANFNPQLIRRSSQLLGLKTESSIRFEKGLHPYLAEQGLQRALELIQEIIPQARVVEITEKNYFSFKPNRIKLSYSFLRKRIGHPLASSEINRLLKNLGFKLKPIKGEEVEIEVPWWRSTGDITIPEDIVEEVARSYGYDQLPEKAEWVRLEKAKYQLEFDLETKIKNYLSLGAGMTEVFNYPWTEERILRRLGFTSPWLELAYPPTEEERFLQPSLIPNLMKNIETNLRFFEQFKIFELARVFQPGEGKFDGQDKLPYQPKMLAGVWVGGKEAEFFLVAKGVIEQLFELSGLAEELSFVPAHQEIPFLEEKKSLKVKLGTQVVGYLGQLKLSLNQEWGWGNKQIVLFELNFSQLVEGRNIIKPTRYQPLPVYPAIVRDLSLVVAQSISWQEILTALKNLDSLIKEIKFLSVYPLSPEKKAVSFRVTYQSEERTLLTEEAEKLEAKIIARLKEKFKAELRE